MITDGIILEDKDFIVINKDCGLFSQASKNRNDSIIELLQPTFENLYPVNRLDAPASGIIIYARNKLTAGILSNQITKNAEKRYLCAVDNCPPVKTGKLVNHLFFKKQRINKTYISLEKRSNTKKAVLLYNYLYKTDNYHILEILLKTGRHHQIRAQLGNMGCHIRGDLKYGAKRSIKGGGISLHAYFLKFNHPKTGKPIELLAKPPDNDPLLKDAFKSNLIPSKFE